MPVPYRTGKKPHVVDDRIPRMSTFFHHQPLPPAPAKSDWYSKVTNWGMLGNDTWGDCVEAAVLHWIMQMSAWVDPTPLVATTNEAEKFYEFTGFDPLRQETDQGTYVLGNDGAMQWWMNRGVTCGGELNKATGFLQMKRKVPSEWQQGIYNFGGMLTGIQLPANILGGDRVPEVWSQVNPEIDGGHEILINGYEDSPSMGKLYNLISWGEMYLATEAFLMQVVDETVVVIDPIEVDARGVNVQGLNMDQLAANMDLLRRAG